MACQGPATASLARSVEPQRAGEPLQYISRRRGAAPLFQPGVPGDAHTRPRAHLLAPEPRCSAPALGTRIERQARPAIATKATESEVRARQGVGCHTWLRSMLF